MRYEFPILDETESEKVEDGYRHKACGELLVGMTVILSNRNGLIPLAGDGSTERITVPYCPSCDDQPPTHGTFTNDGAISHPNVRNVNA